MTAPTMQAIRAVNKELEMAALEFGNKLKKIADKMIAAGFVGDGFCGMCGTPINGSTGIVGFGGNFCTTCYYPTAEQAKYKREMSGRD